MQCIVHLRFRYMFQLCDPCYKAEKLQGIEIKMNQETSPDTDTPATTPPPTSPKKNRSLMLFGALLTFVLAILIELILGKLSNSEN